MRPGWRLWFTSALSAVLLPVGGAAQNLVALSPESQQVLVSTPAAVALQLDFEDPAIGGGIVVEFDSGRLSFTGFTFDSGFPDDPALRLVCPSAAPACAGFSGPGVLVAFGVDTIQDPPIQGAHTVGTLGFDTLALGVAALDTREDDSVAGPLVGSGSFAAPVLGSGEVDVVGNPTVPALPVAGSALLGSLLLAAARYSGSGGTIPGPRARD